MPAMLRPRRVEFAVWLYLASLALGVVSTLVVPAGPLWFSALIVVIMLLFAWALWQRHGWARYVLLFMFLLGLPMLFALREVLAVRGTIGVAVLAVQTLLQGVSLVLLFSGESGPWYKRTSVEAQQQGTINRDA